MEEPPYELIKQQNATVRYERQLRRHPDWRDPEHPEPPDFLNEENNEEDMEQ